MRDPTVEKALERCKTKTAFVLIFLYAATGILQLLNWIIYLRTDSYKELDPAAVTAYISFTAVGLLVQFLISSPLLYWPYHYGSEMSPKARRNFVSFGIILNFVVHDFAKTWLEIYIVITVGFRDIFQSVCLFLSMACFAIGFGTTWISYTWKCSKALQIRYGSAAGNYSMKASAIAKAEHTGGRI